MKNATFFQWTPETIARFWDYMSAKEEMISQYFTKDLGSEITRFLSYTLSLRNKQVLDYGCGPGYLVRHLLEHNAIVSGVDYSEVSVETVNKLFYGRPGWNGARLARGSELPWPDDVFDLICCVETIEHVLPEQLDPLFHELLRLLKPGGMILFTTPDEENLELNFVFCPMCRSEFHRWQHLRMWSDRTLRAKLEEHGYKVMFCRGLNFWNFHDTPSPSWMDMNLRYLGSLIKQSARRLLDHLNPRLFPSGRVFQNLINRDGHPHLVAIATKPLKY
jgi:2-polyprenyl-3-methyl-5-hydroxy-6-metoxy-1,4-benzoquinol methylase